jgi:hypothetical protein
VKLRPLILRDEHGLRMLDNKVRTDEYIRTQDKETKVCRKLHNEELHDLSLYVIVLAVINVFAH